MKQKIITLLLFLLTFNILLAESKTVDLSDKEKAEQYFNTIKDSNFDSTKQFYDLSSLNAFGFIITPRKFDNFSEEFADKNNCVLLSKTCEVLSIPGGIKPNEIKKVGDTIFLGFKDMIVQIVIILHNGKAADYSQNYLSHIKAIALSVLNQEDYKGQGSLRIKIKEDESLKETEIQIIGDNDKVIDIFYLPSKTGKLDLEHDVKETTV